MDFRSYLSDSSKEIAAFSEIFFNKWNRQLSSRYPELQHLHAKFIEHVGGGKMLRGTLLKLGYNLTGKSMKKKILLPALALEILHTGLLIHDDIMDKSTTRRGKPTLYRAFGGDHTGISQAICLGDLAFFLATQMLTESRFSPEKKNEAVRIFTQTTNSTISGQLLDIEICKKPKTDIQNIINMYKSKTAYYTFISPLSIGGILGGADKKWLTAIEKFGENLGIAFQIQDDILGIFGTKKIIGKSITSDIEEGKKTVLYLYALKTASEKDKKTLLKLYGKKNINTSEHEKIKKLFQECGALSYSQSLAENFVKKSQSLIPAITKDKKYRHLLISLTDIVIHRKN